MKDGRLLPSEIEAESFRRIEAIAGDHGFSPDAWSVLRRMIHTTADFDYIQNVRFRTGAIESGVQALRSGANVFTDTRMLLAGISTGRLKRLNVEARCLVDDPKVIEEARTRKTTRSAVAVEKAASFLDGGIIAIGNAPTALLRLLDLLEEGAVKPALIVGMPVGFVQAEESKAALHETGYPYITALGRKGGSPVTASVINALAVMALDKDREA